MTTPNHTAKSSVMGGVPGGPLGLDVRLGFAVRFAQLDLSTLSPGDWLNLQRDLELFFGVLDLNRGSFPDRVMALPTGSSLSTSLKTRTPPAALAGLQEEVLALLASVAQAGRNERLGPPLEVAISTRKRLLFIELGPQDRYVGAVVMARGPLRDVFLDMLLYLVSTTAPDRVRRCPECGTIFLRVRKQVYCSRRCVNRANKRAWLLTPKGQRASQGSRRRAYVKQQQQKFGRKVRVRLNRSRKGSR